MITLWLAVQNGGSHGRVLHLWLSPDGTAITGFEMLEAGNADFDIPTTAAISGDRLALIANSQLKGLGEGGKVTEDPPLKPVKLLEIPIPRRRQLH